MTEEELLELLVGFAPESLEGWLAVAVTVAAVLSFVLPQPSEDAHPLVRSAHKAICIMGLGATKLRAAGKVGKILRRNGGK